MRTQLRGAPLFSGMDDAEIDSLLPCLNARERSYQKGEIIFLAGDVAEAIGLVLEGVVHIVKEDFFGNRTIVAHAEAGELFAEAFSCTEDRRLEVSAVAATACKILLIDYHHVVTTCPMSCAFHSRLIRNMMRILALGNIQLNRKIEHTSKRTTREKLLSYLSEQAKRNQNPRFDIPFNRQELADYLCVERSAMSAELGRMRDEGLLDFNRNSFVLHSEAM
jgi:CRP-like cAMP-binding protein